MLLLKIAMALAVGTIVATLIGLAQRTGPSNGKVGNRTIEFAHVANVVSIGLLLLFVAHSLVVGVTSSHLLTLQSLDLVGFLTVAAAVLVSFSDVTWRYAMAALYAYALGAVGIAQTLRGFSPGRFFTWGIASDLAGFVLLAALLGWILQGVLSRHRLPLGAKLARDWPVEWFLWSQAALTTLAAMLTMWVSLSFSFDGIGQGVALFGLSGRSAGCTAALMLLGTSILMAWQTKGRWRAAWQFAAIAAGMLFTSSLGWARIDAPTSAAAAWLQRSTNLLISTTMMTFMTRIGLARVLPRGSDWIPRARRLSPIFGGLAIIMLAAVLLQRM
jgi:hypothetical protein